LSQEEGTSRGVNRKKKRYYERKKFFKTHGVGKKKHLRGKADGNAGKTSYCQKRIPAVAVVLLGGSERKKKPGEPSGELWPPQRRGCFKRTTGKRAETFRRRGESMSFFEGGFGGGSLKKLLLKRSATITSLIARKKKIPR